MRVKSRVSWFLMLAGCLLLVGLGAYHFSHPARVSAASNAIYGNNAGSAPYVLVMTPGTFAVTDTFSGLSGSNGRGVVVVGGIMYYTSAGSGQVFSYTMATHHDNGLAFSVAGASALSTMAYDGQNFWIGDYSGTNQAYLYSPTGTLLKTIHLASCTGRCDGLEYFVQGGTTPSLISNEGDAITAPYDVYDLNGVVTTPHFISPGVSSTGVAYDGTNFLISDIFNKKISTWNGSTGAFISTATITGFQSSFNPVIEDLSADYSITLNPGPTTASVPTLSEVGLLLCAIFLLASGIFMSRRRVA